MTGQGQLEGFLDRLAALGGVVSAAEAIVATPDAILFRHASGYLVGGERLAPGGGARFDAASLTKPWIATLALALDREGTTEVASSSATDATRDKAEGTDREKHRHEDKDKDKDKDKGKGFHRGERLPHLASASLGARRSDRAETSEASAAPRVTVEDLLRHRSGMPAWTPLALQLGKRLGDRGALSELLLRERLTGSASISTAPESVSAAVSFVSPFNGSLSSFVSSPSPSPSASPSSSSSSSSGQSARTLYSDLGFVLWGLLAEERTGEPLASLLDERVCLPLGVAALGALAVGGGVSGAVECRLDNGKEVELAAQQGWTLARQRSFLRGIPQDGNARALLATGRLPAHAGLFVTADEMLALGREWLRPGRLLSAEQVASALAGDDEYVLGWARWSADGSSGPALSRSSFGHTGFTGGSLWIDPERSRLYVFMAHRLSSSIDFNPFRREFHRLAAEL